tara:strand:- start:32733 stop:32942 length:210 start_codon:yes stop_codon:yes gene_type:complete
MAYRDYICCAECGVKIIYDGYNDSRDALEEIWGDPDAADYTVEMHCPDCVGNMKREIREYRYRLEKLEC